MRTSGENVQLMLYQIYGKLIDFFMTLSEYLINLSELQQGQLKQLVKLFKVMNEVVQSKSINIGFFLCYQDIKFQNLFKMQLNLITKFRPQLRDYPKYRLLVYLLLNNLVSE